MRINDFCFAGLLSGGGPSRGETRSASSLQAEELAVEVRDVAIAAGECDLRHAQFGLRQQAAGAADVQIVDEGGKGLAQRWRKKRLNSAFAHVGPLGDLGELQGAMVIVVDELTDPTHPLLLGPVNWAVKPALAIGWQLRDFANVSSKSRKVVIRRTLLSSSISRSMAATCRRVGSRTCNPLACVEQPPQRDKHRQFQQSRPESLLKLQQHAVGGRRAKRADRCAGRRGGDSCRARPGRPAATSGCCRQRCDSPGFRAPRPVRLPHDNARGNCRRPRDFLFTMKPSSG